LLYEKIPLQWCEYLYSYRRNTTKHNTEMEQPHTNTSGSTTAAAESSTSNTNTKIQGDGDGGGGKTSSNSNSNSNSNSKDAPKRRVVFLTTPNVAATSRRNIHDGSRTERPKINVGIPSRKSVAEYVQSKEVARSHDASGNAKPKKWRTTFHEFVDQEWFQITMQVLLLTDVLIIFTELYLHAEFPSCKLVERDCISCCSGSDSHSHSDADADADAARWLASAASDGGHQGFCDAGYDPTGTAGCDAHKYDTVHTIEEVLFYITITILLIFLVENLVEMAALGVCNYFRQAFLALDFLVITISLAMELSFHFLHNQLTDVAAGVLVLFRCWRFVRIGHGLMEVASEMANSQYDILIEYVKECEEKMKENNVSPPKKHQKVIDILTEVHTHHDHRDHH